MTREVFIEGGWKSRETLNAELAEENLIAVDRRMLAAIIHAAGGVVDVTQGHVFDADRLTLIQDEKPDGGWTFRVGRDA